MTSPGLRTRPQVSVLVVDDHRLFREGLVHILEHFSDLRVVGEAARGDEAVEIARTVEPDVTLLDVQMPGPPIQVTIRQLRRAVPGSRAVMLTMFRDAILERELRRSGAVEYLNKSIGSGELVAAVRKVADAGQSPLAMPSQRAPQILSSRELEVLRLVALGLSTPEMAAELGIARGTLKRHLGSVFAKLAVDSRIRAVVEGRRLGLLGESSGDDSE